MGMSASQARFLMLTARKNNVEFEGQQINQQRTTLSNESASYYSQLCNMVVPTPPSIDDFTKVSYTFDDGALTNTITTMIAKNDGKFSISYIQQWQDDYSIVSASSSMVSKNLAGEYKVGPSVLRQLGVGGGVIGTTFEGKPIKYNSEGKAYIEETREVPSTEECSEEEIANFRFAMSDGKNVENSVPVYKYAQGDEQSGFYTIDDDGNKTPLDNITEDDLIIYLYVESGDSPDTAIIYVAKDENGKYQKESKTEETYNRYLTEAELGSVSSFDDPYLSSLTPEQIYSLLEQEEYYRVMLNEKYFHDPGSDQQWYVRYVQDSVKKTYVPFFYNMEEVQNASYPADGGFANGNINCYSVGSSTKTKEVINALGSVEKDITGRYISLILYKTDENGNITKDANGNDVFTQYSLVTNTSTDEDAYNDAMNKYNYAQYQYDQKVQEINSKIEVVQQQDKSLELELKQLDTEENAISTEMEAVKKVISKNVESSFKTFNA